MLYFVALSPLAFASPPEVLREPPGGSPTFTVGIAGTQPRLAQHIDGSVALIASDGHRSVVCTGDRQVWGGYRDYFAELIGF